MHSSTNSLSLDNLPLPSLIPLLLKTKSILSAPSPYPGDPQVRPHYYSKIASYLRQGEFGPVQLLAATILPTSPAITLHLSTGKHRHVPTQVLPLSEGNLPHFPSLQSCYHN